MAELLSRRQCDGISLGQPKHQLGDPDPLVMTFRVVVAVNGKAARTRLNVPSNLSRERGLVLIAALYFPGKAY